MRTNAMGAALAAALLLAWSVPALAEPAHGRGVLVAHLFVRVGTPYTVAPLLGGPDYPFPVPPLEGHRTTAERAYLTPDTAYALPGAVAPLASRQPEPPAPAPAPPDKR
jgi:hypothetical protein